MATFVLDASAVLKGVLDEPGSTSYRKWLARAIANGAEFHSTTLLPYEVAQGVFGTGTPLIEGVVDRALYGLRLHSMHRQALRFVGPLSVYDASYLATAVELGATLVTYDRKMADVARRGGVKVVSP